MEKKDGKTIAQKLDELIHNNINSSDVRGVFVENALKYQKQRLTLSLRNLFFGTGFFSYFRNWIVISEEKLSKIFKDVGLVKEEEDFKLILSYLVSENFYQKYDDIYILEIKKIIQPSNSNSSTYSVRKHMDSEY